jgi:hypothetical protein
MREETAMRSAFGQILNWCYPGRLTSKDFLQLDSHQEAAYNLFVREHGLDTDFDNHPEFPDHYDPTKALDLTKSSFEIILANQPSSFASLPFTQRFSTAIASTGWPADAFLTLLLRPNPTETVTQARQDGKTALHWAAAHFGEWLHMGPYSRGVMRKSRYPRLRAESYGNLVSTSVRLGSDIYASWHVPVIEFGETHYGESDPFVGFLRGLRLDQSGGFSYSSWTRERLRDAVDQWGRMLVAGGHLLNHFVAAENHFLSRTHLIDAIDHGTWAFIPTKLTLLGKGTLSMHVIDVFNLPVWRAEPIRVPGAWPAFSTSPSVIMWNPDIEDEQDGFQWTKIASVRIRSEPYLIGPLHLPAQRSDLVGWASTVRQQLIYSATQDDHGILANIITRERRSCRDQSRIQSRQRSSSLPLVPARSKYNQNHESLRPTTYTSYGNTYAVHKCASDLRWSSSSRFVVSLRVCMRSHQLDRHSTDLEPYPNGWERELLDNENHVRVARRFAEQFHPAYVYMVDETSEIATERARLMMGPRRREDDNM